MRKFYLVSSITVGILILIMAFAQLGASCSLYLFSTDTPVFLVFLQTSAIGAIFGGLLVFYWKMPKEGAEDVEDDVTPPTPPVPPKTV